MNEYLLQRSDNLLSTLDLVLVPLRLVALPHLRTSASDPLPVSFADLNAVHLALSFELDIVILGAVVVIDDG